jgi:arylsulfatase A-like enzyme
MGPRGDAIAEFDWSVGQILETLDRLGLAKNTLVILSSDNGPVVDDGYQDHAVEKLGTHKPSGSLRGGKYSAFEAGTRIPFIVRWPGNVKPGISKSLVSQIDLFSSFSHLTGQPVPENAAPDSFDSLPVWLGKSLENRSYIIQGSGGTLSLVMDDWKYITPGKGARYNPNVNIELGNDSVPQLYNLSLDLGEKTNVAKEQPEIVEKLTVKLTSVKESAQTRQ